MITKWRRLPAWQINLWSTVVAQLLTLLGFQAGFILIPYYIQQMGITDPNQVAAWSGAYQSMGSIGLAIFTPIWGMMGDRYGRKPMLVRATAATALIVTLMGLARTPTQLMILRVVQGCLTGTPAAAAALVATSSPKEHLAYGLGLAQTAVFIGSSIGPMFGGYVGDSISYRATFFISGMIILAALLLIVFLVREPEREPVAPAMTEKFIPTSSSPVALRKILSFRLLSLIGLTLAFNMTFSLLGPVIPLLIQQIVVDQARLASIAGTITGVSALASAISALVVGRLSPRLGHGRTLLGCSVGTAALYVPMAFSRSAFGLGLLQGIQGLFRGGISPSTSAMVVDCSSKDRIGIVLGLNSSAASVGFGLGPILGAALLTVSSSSMVFLVAGSVMALVTALVAFEVRRPVSGTQGAEPAMQAEPGGQ